MKQLRIPLKALEPFNINIVSKNSWICSYHLQVLNPYVGNEENMRPFPYSFAFENENVRPSLLMNVLETDVRNVLSPLPEDLNNGHDVHRSFSNPRPSRFLDTVLELVEGNYAIIGDSQSSMIADASRENCNDEINMAAASTSDAKISTDGPSQKEVEEEGENESSSHGVETPKAVVEEVGSNTKPEEPSNNPPLTPPTNGDIHRETIEGAAKEEGNDGHVSSGDESPKLVINEICDRKEARNLTKTEASVPILPTETIPSIPQERSSENSSPKSPSLKRSATATDDVEAVENLPKKPRLYEDVVDPMSGINIAQIDTSVAQLRTEIENLGVDIARKEEEWNSLIRMQKRKEEALAVLERRRAVWTIKQEEGRSNASDEQEENLAAIASHNLYNSQFPLIMMKHMFGESLMNRMAPQSNRPPSRHRDSSSSNGPKAPSPNNISIIDIHTNNSRSSSVSDSPQVSISPEAHSKLGRHLNSIMSVKPILPKPPTNNLAPTSNHVGNPTPLYPSVKRLCFPEERKGVLGDISTKERNEDHQEKPTRPSSVSSSNNETDLRLNSSLNPKAHLSNVNNSSPLTMNDSIVSYKDVLLQFAQLTQTEKSPGSPQISIIPVSSSDTPSRKFEHTPDSTSVSRELSIPPQASNQSPSLEGSSALAKLLLESGAGNHGSGAKNSAVDLSSYGSSPDSLTLSALLSGGTMTTHKEKPSSGSQMESRPKKNPPTDETGSNPKCQGCHKQRAQFVCAGCSNQWYCSRSCQMF
ncbi:hypothetical protein Avbf_03253 [Armadillidium vulgare]|nr:hypothetical protein Avbf_03253 [Armadillidium vulgare]